MMRAHGFESLHGFDPYISTGGRIAAGVELHRAEPSEMPYGWAAIMLNHAFEHMPDPVAVLLRLRSRITRGGFVLIRVPVADCVARREYGVDWIQLDAPRHLFIPTHRAMTEIAGRAGFRVGRVFHDSTAMQFWGSEQYKLRIPLRAAESWAEGNAKLFPADQMKRWDRRARQLNRYGGADSAGFVLVPDDG